MLEEKQIVEKNIYMWNQHYYFDLPKIRACRVQQKIK